MTYFPKKTKEIDAKTLIDICAKKRIKRWDGCYSEDTIRKLSKIMAARLTGEEFKSLREIADSDTGAYVSDSVFNGKFWYIREFTDKKTFLEGFYYIFLPAIIIVRDKETDKVPDDVRCDFLRYFISWDCFEKHRGASFSSAYIFDGFHNKFSNFDNISKLYEFAANMIRLDGDCPPPVYEDEDWSHQIRCIYEVSVGLFYNPDFLELAFKKNVLALGTYIKLLRQLAKEGKKRPDKKLRDDLYRINTMPNIVGFYGLNERDERDEVRKKRIAEKIFSTIEDIKKIFEDGRSCKSKNQEFFSIVSALDTAYEMKIIQLIIESEVKQDEWIDAKHDWDLFTRLFFILAISIYDYDFPCFDAEKDKKKFDEILLLILKIFLNEKLCKNECFKKLPEFFQHMVVIEQIRSVYGKAEVLPELGIDKEKLKKEINIFFADLKKMAKNGGKPSDYYAGEPFESDNIADSESYLTSLVFQTAVSFLADNFGAWKAVRPMLAIFRNLKEQAYSIDMKYYEYGRYSWSFVPVRLIQFLGSLEGGDSENVSEAWFDHIAKQLSSADEIEVKKRDEKPENVPDEFKDGYDIKVVEAHPLWREAYCRAAGELGIHPRFEKYKVFNYLIKNDVDANVREAAEDTFKSIEKINGKFNSGSRKSALLNAWRCYRIAHLISLNVEVSDDDLSDLESTELTTNYPKYFETPKIQPVEKQS